MIHLIPGVIALVLTFYLGDCVSLIKPALLKWIMFVPISCLLAISIVLIMVGVSELID